MFNTAIDDIKCTCVVTYYAPGAPMRVTGWGFGDAEPPAPEEFEFELYIDNKRAPWLEDRVSDFELDQLIKQYKDEY